jgi:hypothetical protein
MAFVSAQEIADGRAFDFQGNDSTSFPRVFRVTTDSKLDVPLNLQASMPVAYGQYHPIFTGYRILGESWENTQTGPNRSVWIATYTYRTQQVDQAEMEAKELHPNPLDRRARVSVRSVRYSKLINKDINGKAFITSAGESYPAQEIDDERWTITVRKNYVNIPDFVWTYQKKINSSAITVKGRSLDAETVKFGEVSVPDLQIENGHEFYPIEFTLDYKRDGWGLSLLDAGFLYKDGTDLKEITVKDADGNTVPTTVAILLDGSGGVLHETLGHPVTASDTVFYNDYCL